MGRFEIDAANSRRKFALKLALVLHQRVLSEERGAKLEGRHEEGRRSEFEAAEPARQQPAGSLAYRAEFGLCTTSIPCCTRMGPIDSAKSLRMACLMVGAAAYSISSVSGKKNCPRYLLNSCRGADAKLCTSPTKISSLNSKETNWPLCVFDT